MSDNALSKLKQAFNEGFEAFSKCDERRKMVVANPYRNNTILAKEWERGFNRAYAENNGTITVPNSGNK